MLTLWWEMWRAFWMRPEPKPPPKPEKLCSLEDLVRAFDEYLESSRLTTERAAKNVEDANLLIAALQENVEDGQRLQAALADLKERKHQSSCAEPK
jgi:hypothetical protein